jgi:DSF synthase
MALARQDLRLIVRPSDRAAGAAPYSDSRAHPGPEVVDAARLAFRYANLETGLEAEAGILWATMRHPERACFTPGLVADGQHFQRWLRRTYGGHGRARPPFRHLVLRSASGGAWNLGGDLSTFTRLIRARDAGKLRAYAHSTIELLHDHYKAYDLPIATAALIQGDAVGGGFEALLTNDVVIAERGARFGFPEILFGLFPGMGAYSFLKRRLGERQARMLIEDGKTRTADELHQLGLIDVLCEKGEGEAAVRRYAAEQAPRFETALTLAKVRRRADPVTREELVDIVEMWVELALQLGEPELRRMDALARHQERLRARS